LIWRAAWLDEEVGFCLVTVVAAGLLLEAALLDELGVWATASMDTKPVIRKILIIIINFFIAFPFYWFEVTVKTPMRPLSLMLHHNFLVGNLVAALQSDHIDSVRKLIDRDIHLTDGLISI